MNELFFMRFLINTCFAAVIILLLMLVKRGMKNHISVRWQYNLSLLTLVLLVMPLIPEKLLRVIRSGSGSLHEFSFGTSTSAGAEAAGYAVQSGAGVNWMQDFAISADRLNPGVVITGLMVAWLIGVAVFTVSAVVCNHRLRLVKESVKPVEDQEFALLTARCKAELGIRRDILVGTSVLVKSPITIGFFRKRIILPGDIMDQASADDIRYVLMHELTHCKYRDVSFNNVMCLLQIVYWFHPLVYLIFKEMRMERELACDWSVLKRLPQDQHGSYGRTLLKFVSRMGRPAILSFATDLGGSGAQIKKRVANIVEFTADSRLMKMKSIGVFALTAVIILSQIPLNAALAANGDNKYQLQNEDVVDEDLSRFFEGFEGSFVLYDLNADDYTVYNKEKSITRVSPNSTYKIYSALTALETGVISAEHSQQEWDGIVYPYEAWNRDQDLKSAMQNSVNWYFHNTDEQVGIEVLGEYLTRLEYGNHDLSGGIKEYWMESTLLISPVEQVELLKDFYLGETVFKDEHVRTVKDALRLSKQDGAVLSGKTGTGSVNGKVTSGWFVGYVEKPEETYIFAVNIQGENHAGGSVAAQIALSILADKNIYQQQ